MLWVLIRFRRIRFPEQEQLMNSHCWCQCCQELQLAARKAGFPQESAEVAGTPIAFGGEHGGFVLPAVHKSQISSHQM